MDSARAAGLHEAPLAPILDRLYRLSLASPLCRRTRYDRTERLAKQRLHEEAGRKIAGGTPPEETGIPGLGALPMLRP